MRAITTILIVLLSLQTSLAEVSSLEKQALIDLYQSTNGNDWTNSWNLNTSVDTWQGVQVVDNKVVALNLSNNNLTGKLPVSIGNLEHLRVLNLHNNNLIGTLPTTIGQLENLVKLNVSINHLEGYIPNEVSTMRSLEYAYLFSNDFTGVLPVAIHKMPNIKGISYYATKIEDSHLDALLASN